MSFTPPTTIASQGTTGYLSEFQVGDNMSPPNWTTIAEVKTFTFTPLDVPNVDFSHLLSPNNTREYRPGMIAPGTIEMSGNLLLDVSQLAIISNAEAQAVVPVRGIFPVQDSTKTGQFIGTAFVKSLKLGPFELDKPNEFAASFQAAGAFTPSAT